MSCQVCFCRGCLQFGWTRTRRGKGRPNGRSSAKSEFLTQVPIELTAPVAIFSPLKSPLKSYFRSSQALTDLKAVLTETSTTAFNVSWTESSPLSPASSSRRYRLSWGLTEEELRWNVIETSNTSVLVKDLLSCEDYIFSVQRIALSRSKAYVKGRDSYDRW